MANPREDQQVFDGESGLEQRLIEIDHQLKSSKEEMETFENVFQQEIPICFNQEVQKNEKEKELKEETSSTQKSG